MTTAHRAIDAFNGVLAKHLRIPNDLTHRIAMQHAIDTANKPEPVPEPVDPEFEEHAHRELLSGDLYEAAKSAWKAAKVQAAAVPLPVCADPTDAVLALELRGRTMAGDVVR